MDHSFTDYVSDGNATCTEDGSKTAKCDRCEATNTVTDTGSALGHSYSTEWSYDQHTHWHECGCGDKIEEADHDFSTGSCICGAEKPMEVISRNVSYTVRENVVTVKNDQACKLGYWNGETQSYVEIPCTANDDGSYAFAVPEGVKEVLLVVIGDIDGNGLLEEADNTLLAGYLVSDQTLSDAQRFAADVNDNGKINSADRTLIARALLPEDHAAYKPFAWNT